MAEHIPPRTHTAPTGIAAEENSMNGHSLGKTILIDNYDSFTYNVVEVRAN